jgi:hypothetical protein
MQPASVSSMPSASFRFGGSFGGTIEPSTGKRTFILSRTRFAASRPASRSCGSSFEGCGSAAAGALGEVATAENPREAACGGGDEGCFGSRKETLQPKNP